VYVVPGTSAELILVDGPPETVPLYTLQPATSPELPGLTTGRSHGIGQNSQPPRKLSQLMLYPAPVRLAEKTVILEVSVFVSLGASTFELPNITLPNHRFPGLQLRAPVLV